MVFLILTFNSSYKIQKMVNQYCYFVVGATAASSTHISPSGDFDLLITPFQRNNVTRYLCISFGFNVPFQEIIPFPSRPPLLSV
jgi:hypothetical protein